MKKQIQTRKAAGRKAAGPLAKLGLTQLMAVMAAANLLYPRKPAKPRKPGYNKNGVVIFENDSIVAIATGLKSRSANAKTGSMIQVWILVRNVSPLDAIKLGLDKAICIDCPHMGRLVDGLVKDRRCYVNVGQAPMSVWKCYQNGGYRMAEESEYGALFGDRFVRFGSYGEPVLIPLPILQAIAAVSRDWTGYTHQWRREEYAEYRSLLMASADSDRDSWDANSLGWRYFRVRAAGDTTLDAGEIKCPASKESGNRVKCEDCRLCNGVKHGENETRKNIVIQDHSNIAKRKPLQNQPLIQISLGAPSLAPMVETQTQAYIRQVSYLPAY